VRTQVECKSSRCHRGFSANGVFDLIHYAGWWREIIRSVVHQPCQLWKLAARQRRQQNRHDKKSGDVALELEVHIKGYEPKHRAEAKFD